MDMGVRRILLLTYRLWPKTGLITPNHSSVKRRIQALCIKDFNPLSTEDSHGGNARYEDEDSTLPNDGFDIIMFGNSAVCQTKENGETRYNGASNIHESA